MRRPDVDHPDELRLDLDPQPGTGFGVPSGVMKVATRVAGGARPARLPEASGNRGIHIYLRIRPDYTFEQVRHAAIRFGRELERRDGVTAWWKEERGERISGLQPEQPRPDDRRRLEPTGPSGAPVSAPMTGEAWPG
ncbi:MAG: hypothetical protein R2719_10040 [Micropruina sp.]